MKQFIQDALVAAHLDEEAALIGEVPTNIEPYPTPFFTHYQLFKVVCNTPYKPLGLSLGLAPGRLDLPLYSVTDDPQAFMALARADHVHLNTSEMAATYTEVFLNATRSLSEFAQTIHTVD